MPTLCQALRTHGHVHDSRSTVFKEAIFQKEVRSLLKTSLPALLSSPYHCSCHHPWVSMHTSISAPKDPASWPLELSTTSAAHPFDTSQTSSL